MNVKDLPPKFNQVQEVEILRLDLHKMEGRKIKTKGVFIFKCDDEYYTIDTPYWWTQNFIELFQPKRPQFILVQRELYNDNKNGRLKYLGACHKDTFEF